MTRPKVLLLDEPSMGLAPVLVDLIYDSIKEINASGTTILLVEQNAFMALSVAGRGYVLQTGEVVLQGSSS
ncbi:MAG: branched-chain amino acid ABC transporter ATP-binding protein, partial [Desulfomonilaceae bacterium]|nr:branched-chain amino acid ABC transporter ATP-binding protein [Desulfomonilaceae bacterium]